jgi:hypothetical protein
LEDWNVRQDWLVIDGADGTRLLILDGSRLGHDRLLVLDCDLETEL